jgi:hypothetical protein
MNVTGLVSYSSFDYDLALRSCGEDKIIFGETISLFRKQVPYLIDHIIKALEGNDRKLLNKAAYTLGELLVHLGAYKALNCLKELETNPEGISTNICLDQFAELKLEIDILLSQLRDANKTPQVVTIV